MNDGKVFEEFSTDVDAVFASDIFDHPAHDEKSIDEENFDEQYPIAGREFALALEDAFETESTTRRAGGEAENREPGWEHGHWYLFINHEGRRFTIYLWPIPTSTPLWWLSVSENRGCLMVLFGLGSSDRIPRTLQQRLQVTVEKVAKAKDFRWTTKENVMEMF